MNAKRAKAIRREIRALAKIKGELPDRLAIASNGQKINAKNNFYRRLKSVVQSNRVGFTQISGSLTRVARGSAATQRPV